jgi:hypothetical protein
MAPPMRCRRRQQLGKRVYEVFSRLGPVGGAVDLVRHTSQRNSIYWVAVSAIDKLKHQTVAQTHF